MNVTMGRAQLPTAHLYRYIKIFVEFLLLTIDGRTALNKINKILMSICVKSMTSRVLSILLV